MAGIRLKTDHFKTNFKINIMIVDNKGHQKLENFKELFVVKVTSLFFKYKYEGARIPRFYLPVKKNTFNNTIECWIFPLAIFVVLYYIAKGVLKFIWLDLLDFIEILNIKND